MHSQAFSTDCWYLTGPTACGKTEVGIELASLLDAEIISLDSMAIYRGMNIGTATPSDEQLDIVPHHLINIVDPAEEFSVARYIEAAAQKVADIREKGREVLFVGGTPLYLKSLLRGMFEGPQADWEFRQQVEQELQQVDPQELYHRLQQVDPLSADKLHPRDTRRLIRALEVYKLTGQPISHLQMQFEEGRSAQECKVFVIDRARAELHERINLRVEEMIDAGLILEVQELIAGDRELGRTASQAVGYREILAYLNDELTLDEVKEQMKARTRRFAKRQGTWFRSLSECRFVTVEEGQTSKDLAERILALGQTG